MPNSQNEKTWKDIREQVNELERKENLITIRNTLDGVIVCAENADSFEKFVENLKIFRNKCNNLIEK